jgi:hypothetical protein
MFMNPDESLAREHNEELRREARKRRLQRMLRADHAQHLGAHITPRLGQG